MKETIVFISGILLTIIPFLGIPEQWRQYSILGIGAILILVGYVLRRAVYVARLDLGNGERGNDSYVETTEQLFEQRTIE